MNSIFFEFPDEDRGASHLYSHAWVTDRLDLERKITHWCLERIGPEGFPYWGFIKSYIYVPDPISSSGIIEALISVGIYIAKDEDRVAFKMTFNCV